MSDAEIVKALAEKVMGWKRVRCGAPPHWASYVGSDRIDAVVACDEWNPLTSEADACAVLDTLSERSGVTLMSDSRDGVWGCMVDGIDQVWAPTRRRAICLAALKAVGVEVTDGC